MNSSVGVEVLTVRATDADSGPNGEVSYFLSGSEVGRFLIDGTSGVVTVRMPLDYETFTEPYVLTVIASDSGRQSCCVDCVNLCQCESRINVLLC